MLVLNRKTIENSSKYDVYGTLISNKILLRLLGFRIVNYFKGDLNNKYVNYVKI